MEVHCLKCCFVLEVLDIEHKASCMYMCPIIGPQSQPVSYNFDERKLKHSRIKKTSKQPCFFNYSTSSLCKSSHNYSLSLEQPPLVTSLNKTQQSFLELTTVTVLLCMRQLDRLIFCQWWWLVNQVFFFAVVAVLLLFFSGNHSLLKLRVAMFGGFVKGLLNIWRQNPGQMHRSSSRALVTHSFNLMQNW